MGIEELIARLERDADARVAKIRERAKAEKDAIEAASAALSERLRAEALAARARERRVKFDQALAVARQRANAERLAAEYALLERILARTRELIAVVDVEPEYLAAVPLQLERALRFVEGRPIVVRCRPSIAPAARAALAMRSDATVEEAPDAPVGIRIALRDGSMEVDDTLLERLSRLRTRLAIELVGEVTP